MLWILYCLEKYFRQEFLFEMKRKKFVLKSGEVDIIKSNPFITGVIIMNTSKANVKTRYDKYTKILWVGIEEKKKK